MRVRHKLASAVLACPLLLAGCSFGTQPEAPSYASITSNTFVAANYRAADELLKQLSGKIVDGQPLIMATIVNIDSLDESSTLGRVVSEQVSTRLAQRGLKMLEMKLRSNVYLKRNQGELMLTREIGEVAHNHNAQAVVVGSYAETSDTVFVNIKVIQPTNNFVLAGHDFVLAKDPTIRSMLKRY